MHLPVPSLRLRGVLACLVLLLVPALAACSGPAISIPPTPTPNPAATVVAQNHQHGEASMGSGNARLVTRYGGDITVDMAASPSQPTAGKPFDIAYTLTGKDGLPVTANKLQVTHEHLLHLIVVSKDLKQFAHIHPEDT